MAWKAAVALFGGLTGDDGDAIAFGFDEALAVFLGNRELLVKRYEPKASVADMAAAIRLTPKALSDRLRRIRQVLLDCITKTLAEEALP